ncbi:hypothetical protein ABIB51_004093 [Arthrobacter sp. UYCu712]
MRRRPAQLIGIENGSGRITWSIRMASQTGNAASGTPSPVRGRSIACHAGSRTFDHEMCGEGEPVAMTLTDCHRVPCLTGGCSIAAGDRAPALAPEPSSSERNEITLKMELPRSDRRGSRPGEWRKMGKRKCGHCPHFRLRIGSYIGRTGPYWGCLREFPVFSRAGMQFESHLGHSVLAGQRRFSLKLALFRVHNVHTLASDLLLREVCGFPGPYSVVWGSRFSPASRVPTEQTSSGSSSLVLPVGFRLHQFMAAMAGDNMNC